MLSNRPNSHSTLWRLRKKLRSGLHSKSSVGPRTVWRILILSCFVFAALFGRSIFSEHDRLAERFLAIDAVKSGAILKPPRYPLALVSKRSQDGKDVYPHQVPYNGTAYHITTSVGPAKDLHKTHYFLTSLWFFEDDHPFQRQRPQEPMTKNVQHFQVECDYDHGLEIVPGTGEDQIREEFYHIECGVPSWLAEELDRSASEERRASAIERMRGVNVEIKIWVDASLGKDTSESFDGFQTRQRDGRLQLLMVSHTVRQWEAPELETEVAVCTNPLRFDAMMTMTDVLEWRLFHAYQGIDRVHWYARTPEFGTWVEKANEVLGFNDTYLLAPKLSPATPHAYDYADQSIWLQDCVLRYGIFDKWLAMFDIDEYLFPVNNPAKNAVRDRLRSLDEKVGTVTVFQTYYGGDRVDTAPTLEGFDRFPRNALTRWEPNYLKAGVRYTKAIHRSIGARIVWVHNAVHRGWWYSSHEEDAQEDTTGVLNLLHSRRSPYPNVAYPAVNEVDNPAWHEQWDTLAKAMTGLEVLHTLPS